MNSRRIVGPTRQALLRRIARVAPRPPERLLPGLLEVASAARSAGPSLLPPAARRVLVLVPHPDDEAIGAGGLMALLAERGADVAAILVTDGEATIGASRAPAEVGRRRRAEFVRSVAVLGGRVHTTLALPDGEVVKARELSGLPHLLFRRHSVTGALEVVQRSGTWGGLNAALHATD